MSDKAVNIVSKLMEQIMSNHRVAEAVTFEVNNPEFRYNSMDTNVSWPWNPFIGEWY